MRRRGGRGPLHPVHRGRDRAARSSRTRSSVGRRRLERSRRAGARARCRVRARRPRPGDRPAGRAGSRCASAGASRSERLTGLGARHGLHLDQAGRRVAARRRPPLHRARLPARHARHRRDPAGRLRAACPGSCPAAARARGWRPTATARCSTSATGSRSSARAAAGPLRLHLFCRPHARRRACARSCGATRLPALLPEWGYGHWKSRDVYEHQRDVEDDFEGYRAHRLPLDAIVLDSPWETQYNTWEFNPHQFPDPARADRADARAGVRTVVWVTPWVNVESVDGQRPPDPESDRLHREPARELRRGSARPLRQGGRRRAVRGALVDGHAARPWTSPRRRPRRWWREQAKRVLALGVEGIKADDGEGYYFPTTCAFADGRTGAEAAWAHGRPVPPLDAARARRGPPGRGRGVRAAGWTGQQAVGVTWGGDQASDFWSLRALVAATLTAAARGLLELVARRRRLPRRAAHRALPEGAARALGAVRLLHAADAGARALRAGGVDLRRRRRSTLYREYVLLHERLVPYIRAAAATAARCGLPIVRPLCSPTPATRAAGRSPTPTATGRRCGWRRCWRRARASARSSCRGATGSTSGPASAWPAAARSWRARRSGGSRCGCAAARSSSPTRPSTSPRPGRRARGRAPARGDAVGRAAARPRARAAGRRHRGALDARRVVGTARTRRVVRDPLVVPSVSSAHNPAESGSCLPVHGIREHAGGT